MSDRTLTIALPSHLYEHFRQRAHQQDRTVEDEVLLALAAMAPHEDDLPNDLATALASFAVLDDDALWRLARNRVPARDVARLAELGEKRQRESLKQDELMEAEELVRRHDRVMVVRAEAAALLRARGHNVDRLLTEG